MRYLPPQAERTARRRAAPDVSFIVPRDGEREEGSERASERTRWAEEEREGGRVDVQTIMPTVSDIFSSSVMVMHALPFASNVAPYCCQPDK